MPQTRPPSSQEFGEPFKGHGGTPLRLLLGVLLAALLIAPGPVATAQSEQANSILPKQQLLEEQTWWDNKHWAWYKAHIPFFDSPDTHVNATYYYRWEILTKHLTYGDPETGYTFTEFIDRPFWSGAYGSISCPLGHQFYEVRWLKDFRIIDDFSHYWFGTPGAEPRSYSNWYGDSMWAIYEVWRDEDFIERVYSHMQQQYRGFVEEHFDPDHEMFRWNGLRDGMEVNINGRQTKNEATGADGYRPTLNSYMYADLRALSRTAALLGDSSRARAYDEKATALKQRVQEELWDPDRQFFFHQWAEDKQNGIEAKALTYETGQYAGSSHGRELIGLVPWQFNLPDPGYEEAWTYLIDEDYFWARYGPTTTEQNDPQFYVSPQCCVWSGNSWPYATTQTLKAMANLLNNYDQTVVDEEDYFDLLKVYTRTQRRNGRPYIAEAANPYTGSWDGHNHFYHSEHYLHSGYVDLIVTGLAGLRPRADDTLEVNPMVPETWDYFALDDVAYHGHRVSIVWDRDGSEYDRGKGLMLFVDGEKVASAPTLQRMTVQIPPPPDRAAPERPSNVAVNNQKQFYPHVSASYSHPKAPPFYANDGNYWYHPSPPNRWTTEGLDRDREWLGVDFGTERTINTVKLYFLNDGSGILPPKSYTVEYWTGENWAAIPAPEREPATPTGHRPNVVTFEALQTQKVRVVVRPRSGAAVGLTEFEVWSAAELPLAEPNDAGSNLAYNPDTTGLPTVRASYSNEGDAVTEATDMKTPMLSARRENRWTAYESPNERDWVEVDFGSEKTVRRLDLYLWGDGRGVGAPAAYSIEYWAEGEWHTATVETRRPSTPTAMAKNAVLIEPVETRKVRVVLEHDLPQYAGLAELMIWSDEQPMTP